MPSVVAAMQVNYMYVAYVLQDDNRIVQLCVFNREDIVTQLVNGDEAMAAPVAQLHCNMIPD